MTIVIIGAGIIGASIAEALAVRGAGVTVVDMRAPGRGATFASAGLLAPYTEAHGSTGLLTLGARSLAMFDDFITGAAGRSGRAVEYSRSGTLDVAMNALDVERLRRHAQGLTEAGVDNEWLDVDSLRRFEPAISPRAQGGLHTKPHGLVGVQSLLSALVQSARLAGAVFESPVEAADVAPSGAGVIVRAGERQYVADHAIVCAGCWSRRVRVAGAAPPPVKPVRGQLLCLQWSTTPLRGVVWSSDCYVVPWSDGTVLVGATAEDAGFDESTTVEGVSALTEAVQAVLPGAARARLKEVRVGLRPASPDGLPIIGPSGAANVTYATGHYRNGILLAPLTASVVASLVLDGVPDPVLSIASPCRSALTSSAR